jgi:hypothetical protein
MASRALRAVGMGLAYVVAGVPAAIGVWFVARFAYVTSDTAIDGASNAFLFGMIAVGAYAGPAIALAVAGRGRRVAACTWGVLALAAIVTNWTLTLGALANRSAGTEAERVKLAATMADDQARLGGIERERGAMVFTAMDADAVAAAKRAADTATKNREVECAKRGMNCRQRELDEQVAADKLATASTNKAATDRAAQLDAEATIIRARLVKAPAVKEANTFGKALGRILPLSAATAATAQQWLMSAIVELLIAGVLALPELLRVPLRRGLAAQAAEVRAREGLATQIETKEPEILPPRLAASAEPSQRVRTRQDASGQRPTAVPAIATSNEAPMSTHADVIDPRPVVAFFAKHVPPARGSRADWAIIYGGFLEHGGNYLSASQFGAVLRHICEQAGIRVRRQGDRVYCVDRRFTWEP